MSDREKLLGIVVGCLLALFAVFGVYRMVTGGIQTRTSQISNLESKMKIERQKRDRGKLDQQDVYEYRARSLPSDVNTAHRNYVHWLESQVKECGLEQHAVSFKGLPRRTRTQEEIKELSYSIHGVGNISQITKLLYSIHSADNLHRIRSLTLSKKDGDQLQLTMWVDALCMAEIDKAKTTIGEVVESKLSLPLEEYEKQIAARNLFSPANQAPALSSLGTQEVEVGKRWSYKVKATDPEDHKLTFQLGEDAPSSAKISKSGTLTWNPKEIEEYEFEIFVSDDGIPSKEDVGTLKVKVVPEKVADKLDPSKLATLTMIYQGADDPMPEMCMLLGDKDERKYLRPGDKIKIGKWSGSIVAVEPDRSIVRIQTDDGEFELRLGQVLADAKLVEAATL